MVPEQLAALDEIIYAVESLDLKDERGRISQERFLSCLAGLDEPFSREAAPTHVTASAIVVGTRGILLHRHRLLGRWMQPGGHIDAGEMPWDAAVRETLEETGLECRHPKDGPMIVHVDVHKGPRCDDHLDLRYLLFGPEEDPAPGPGESEDVAWWAPEHASEVADEALIGALSAIAALSEP